MFTSMICAPFSTCSRATVSAPSKSSAAMSFLKRADPQTLVRSPMWMKAARRSKPRIDGFSATHHFSDGGEWSF